MIYTSADQLIGKTPLLELTHIEKELGLQASLLIQQTQKLILRQLVQKFMKIPKATSMCLLPVSAQAVQSQVLVST